MSWLGDENMRKDIDLSFSKHPLTNDLATKKDNSAVKQAIRNIVLTGYYERGFNIEFGTPIRQSLFENIDPLVARTIRDNIEQAIKNFEPQAELIDVYMDASIDQNELLATVVYTYINNPVEQTLNINLNRIR